MIVIGFLLVLFTFCDLVICPLWWPWVARLFKKKDKKLAAKYRVVETYKGDALKYHGEQWRKMDSGYHEGFHKWKKMTIEFDTPEEAQSAIEEWREQKRREKHHEVVGEIF